MNIVILDSNMLLRTDLKKRFAQDGHLTLASFGTAGDVIRQIKERAAEAVDLILLGSSCGGKSADELLLELRREAPFANSRVVVLVEESDVGALQDYLRLGLLGCLFKPTSVDSVVNYVHQMIRVDGVLSDQRHMMDCVLAAQIAERKGNYHGVVDVLQRVVAVNDHPWFLYDLGRAYAMTKQMSEAGRAFQQVLVRNSNFNPQIKAFVCRLGVPMPTDQEKIPNYAVKAFDTSFDSQAHAPLGMDGVQSVLMSNKLDGTWQDVLEELGVPDRRQRELGPDLYQELNFRPADIVILTAQAVFDGTMEGMARSHNFSGTKILVVVNGKVDAEALPEYFMGGCHWLIEAGSGRLKALEALHRIMTLHEMTRTAGAGRPYCLAAYYAFLEGRFSEAQSLSQTALQKYPLDGLARFVIGSVYLNEGQFEEAELCFEVAAKFSPELRPLCQSAMADFNGISQGQPVTGLAPKAS